MGMLFLSLIVLIMKRSLRIRWRKHQREFAISGFFLAVHWGTYFYALQLSNVSIAIISLFTYPIITTLLEPIFFKTRLENINFITSIMVLVGVVVLVPEFKLENQYTLGLVVGLFSALLYAVRNLVSKKLVATYSGDTTLVIQLLFSAVFLSPSLLLYSFEIDMNTFILLVILSFVTTTMGHTLFLLALKHLTTSSASILASLQPVYAILLAIFIIDEQVQTNIILGGFLIFMAVIIQNIWPNFKHKLKKNNNV